MENEPTNLNNEENDIAGNRENGPVGNTAARPGQPGAGAGLPGGPPTSAAAPAASVSSEALAAAETSMAAGAVDAPDEDNDPRENQEADPERLKATGTYGGNFGNGTQDSFGDESRRENQDSNPDRGEFGAQDPDGSTHGGYGGQNRAADYEPRNSPEDRYYGGPGAPGPQDNAYDGRDERPDPRSTYGFEAGAAPAGGLPTGAAPTNQNDNGARRGPDSGYASDYGRTSLGGGADNAAARPQAGQRNQTDDYRPAQGTAETPGGPQSAAAADHDDTNLAGTASTRSATAEEPAPHERSGYVQAPSGDASQGIGSRGGSYNDAYDDSRAGSTAGSPAKGDQRREDLAQNYGAAAREENRASDEENAADHGAPQRNAGREE